MNESLNFEMIEPADEGTRIKVVGVGGAGGNAVNHMVDSGVQGVEFICANTDAQAIEATRASVTISLGASGLGAGSKPEKGCEAALAAEAEIRDSLAGANLVFITAGMGGGTGTGAAPVIARVAKELGILTVGVVTMPFDFEGQRRLKNAEEGLKELENNVDSLIVVHNEKLLSKLGDDVTMDEAFSYANDVLRNAVGGIAEVIKVPGMVNVDFEDVKTVMGELGRAVMGTATSTGPDRARLAAEQAIACPLLEADDLTGAKAVVVLISATRKSLKLAEIRNAMEAVRAFTTKEPHIIFGTAYDEGLGDNIRVTVIATGLSGKAATAVKSPELTIVPRVTTHGTSPLAASPFSPTGNPVFGSAGFATASASIDSKTAEQNNFGQTDAQTSYQTQPMQAPLQRTGTDDPFPFQFAALLADVPSTSTTYTSVGGQEVATLNQMSAVGNTPVMGPVLGGSKPQATGTSVFRPGRTNAAFKVEALSSAGMDDITIPAFLRKQAD